MRDKLESVQRQTGKVPVELQNLTALPDSCLLVWKWFVRLHSTRTSNGFGANPIQYSEILSYFQLVGVEPEEWELELIRKLDDVVMQFYAEKSAKEETAKPKKKK